MAFLPKNLPPVADFGSLELRLALSEADQELTRLDGIARQIEEPELLFANYLKREAVLSSAIEGTHTTLEDLVLFEATRQLRTADDQQVENYVTALKYGRSRIAEIPVGRRLFCELHETLLRNTNQDEKRPGCIRDCQVFIGRPSFDGARFVPPPHVFIDGLLDNLSDYLERAREVKLIKLAVAHYQFEAIHPFRDGNGRVGRLMISLWLHRQAVLTAPLLYLSAYFERRKSEYYDALLSVSADGTWSAWVQFFLQGVATQSRDAWRRIQRLGALREEYKRRLSGPRAAVGPQQLVDQLFSVPAMSVPNALTFLNITYPAAKASVHKLIDAGILEAKPFIFNGTKFYIARELLRLVEAPLDESGTLASA